MLVGGAKIFGAALGGTKFFQGTKRGFKFFEGLKGAKIFFSRGAPFFLQYPIFTEKLHPPSHKF